MSVACAAMPPRSTPPAGHAPGKSNSWGRRAGVKVKMGSLMSVICIIKLILKVLYRTLYERQCMYISVVLRLQLPNAAQFGFFLSRKSRSNPFEFKFYCFRLTDCGRYAHVECEPHVPPTCGLPDSFAQNIEAMTTDSAPLQQSRGGMLWLRCRGVESSLG